MHVLKNKKNGGVSLDCKGGISLMLNILTIWNMSDTNTTGFMDGEETT